MPQLDPSLAFDFNRVLLWSREPDRKGANTAFTEGPERQAAYLVEMTEQPLRERVKALEAGKETLSQESAALRTALEARIQWEDVVQDHFDTLQSKPTLRDMGGAFARGYRIIAESASRGLLGK